MRTTTTLLITAALSLASGRLAADGVIRRLAWQVETSDPVPRDWALTYGETADLEVRYLDHTRPMDLSGAAVVLHCRTNGMAEGYSFQATGAVMQAQGWAAVRVAPAALLPPGLASCAYVIAVTRGGSTNLLAASGTFRLSGTGAGIFGAALPAPAAAALSARIDGLTNGAARGATALQPADAAGWETGPHQAWLTEEADTVDTVASRGATLSSSDLTLDGTSIIFNPGSGLSDSFKRTGISINTRRLYNTNGVPVFSWAGERITGDGSGLSGLLTVEDDAAALAALASFAATSRAVRVWTPDGTQFCDATGCVWRVDSVTNGVAVRFDDAATVNIPGAGTVHPDDVLIYPETQTGVDVYGIRYSYGYDYTRAMYNGDGDGWSGGPPPSVMYPWASAASNAYSSWSVSPVTTLVSRAATQADLPGLTNGIPAQITEATASLLPTNAAGPGQLEGANGFRMTLAGTNYWILFP